MNSNDSLRKLRIDMPELMMGFECSSPSLHYYLNIETGKVVLVTDDSSFQIEEWSEEAGDEDFNLENHLAESDLPDWQKGSIREAWDVQENYPEKYIDIPEQDSRKGFEDMESFTETVLNQQVKGQLQYALRMKHPFARFKEVLSFRDFERAQWFKYQDNRQRQRALEWLNEEGIELIT